MGFKIKVDLSGIRGFFSRVLGVFRRTDMEPPPVEAPALTPLSETPLPEAAKSPLRYRYAHGDSASGVCPQCAPWIGKETKGDGSDGVPVPPLHANCRCFLIPLDSDLLGAASAESEKDHFEWLESRSPKELASILGKVRARLVASGEVEIWELYDPKGQLYPLQRIGYSEDGVAVMPDGITPRKSRGVIRRG